MPKEKQENWEKEFDRKATWEKFGRLTSDKQKKFVKSFISNLLIQNKQQTAEEIVEIMNDYATEKDHYSTDFFIENLSHSIRQKFIKDNK